MKLKLTIVGALLLGFAFAFPVYALVMDSNTFEEKAMDWAEKRCSEPAQSTLRSADCYVFSKTLEQQEEISSIDQQLAGLALPTLYDGNGARLGTLVTPNNLSIYGSVAFYSEELNLIVPIDNQGVIARGEYLMGWTEPGCTGTPYLLNGHLGNTLSILDTMTLIQINGRYYRPTADFADRTLRSEENYAGQCNEKSQTSYKMAVELIDELPYSPPLAMPISFDAN